MKEDLPVHHTAGIIHNLQYRAGSDAFAAAAFAHDAERFAALHLKRGAIDGAHNAIVGKELGL
jgi:hypothetical protein